MPFAHVGKALPDGWRLVCLSEVDSTNDEIRRRAAEDPQEGLVVAADLQTKGRGRRGREWASPSGNIYISVRLRQAASLADTAQLSYVTALALLHAIERIAPSLKPQMKWPNDVLVNGGKVSGILLETDGDYVILGIGINIAHAPTAPEALYPPISLRACGCDAEPQEILGAFLTELASLVALWRHQGMAAIADLWRAKAIGLNQPIIARLQDGQERHGLFRDLDTDGALLMDTSDGRTERILAADVYFPPQSGSPTG